MILYFVIFLGITHSVESNIKEAVTNQVRRKYSAIAATAARARKAETEAALQSLPPALDFLRRHSACDESESDLCQRLAISRIVSRSDPLLRSLKTGQGKRRLDQVKNFVASIRELEDTGSRTSGMADWSLNVTASFGGGLVDLESRLSRIITRMNRLLSMQIKGTRQAVKSATRRSNSVLRRSIISFIRKLQKFSTDRRKELVQRDQQMRRQSNSKMLETVLRKSADRIYDFHDNIVQVDQNALKQLDKLGGVFDAFQAAVDQFLAKTIKTINDNELAGIQRRLEPQSQAAQTAISGKLQSGQIKFEKLISNAVENFSTKFAQQQATQSAFLADLSDQLEHNTSAILADTEKLSLPDLSRNPSFRLPTVDFRRYLKRLGQLEHVIATIDARSKQPDDYRGILKQAKQDAASLASKIELLTAQIAQESKTASASMQRGLSEQTNALRRDERDVSLAAKDAHMATTAAMTAIKHKLDEEAGKADKMLDDLKTRSLQQITMIAQNFNRQMRALNETFKSANPFLPPRYPVPSLPVVQTEELTADVEKLVEAARIKQQQYTTLIASLNFSASGGDEDHLKVLETATNNMELAAANLHARTIASEVSAGEAAEDFSHKAARLKDAVSEGERQLRALVLRLVDDANTKLMLSVPLDNKVDSVTVYNLEKDLANKKERLEELAGYLEKNSSQVLDDRTNEVHRMSKRVVDFVGEFAASLERMFQLSIETTNVSSRVSMQSPSLQRITHAIAGFNAHLENSISNLPAASLEKHKRDLASAIAEAESAFSRLTSFRFTRASQAVAEAVAEKKRLNESVIYYNQFDVARNLSQVNVVVNSLHALLDDSMNQEVIRRPLQDLNTSLSMALKTRADIFAALNNTFTAWQADETKLISRSNEADRNFNRLVRISTQSTMAALNESILTSEAKLYQTTEEFRSTFVALNNSLREILSGRRQRPTLDILRQATLDNVTTLEKDIHEIVAKSEIDTVSGFLRIQNSQNQQLADMVDAIKASANASLLATKFSAVNAGSFAAQVSQSGALASSVSRDYLQVIDSQTQLVKELLQTFHEKRKLVLEDFRNQSVSPQSVRTRIFDLLTSMDAIVGEALNQAELMETTLRKQQRAVDTDISDRSLEILSDSKNARSSIPHAMTDSLRVAQTVNVYPLKDIADQNDKLITQLEQKVGEDLHRVETTGADAVTSLRRDVQRNEAAIDNSVMQFMSTLRTVVSDKLHSFQP